MLVRTCVSNCKRWVFSPVQFLISTTRNSPHHIFFCIHRIILLTTRPTVVGHEFHTCIWGCNYYNPKFMSIADLECQSDILSSKRPSSILNMNQGCQIQLHLSPYLHQTVIMACCLIISLLLCFFWEVDCCKCKMFSSFSRPCTT